MEPQGANIRFRRYYRTLVPLFKKRDVVAYTMAVLSFLAMSFFGAFAIRPTITTIIELRKHIEDQRQVNERITNKVQDLRRVQAEYTSLKVNGLNNILATLPSNPQAAALVGKLNRLVTDNAIDITILQFSLIPIASTSAQSTNNTSSSTSSSQSIPLQFSLTAKGSYDNIVKFINTLAKMDRLITIDSVDISSSPNANPADTFKDNLTLGLQGKAYVLWDQKGGNGG